MKGRRSHQNSLRIPAAMLGGLLSFSLAAPGLSLADVSKPTVEPYGYIELDSVYSSRDTNPLDPAQFNGYATAAGQNGNSSATFNPRFSVIGLKATQTVGDNNLTGKVEADFYGSNTGNPEPRLRLAYMDWARGDNRLTVGQDWIPVAALLPSALDFSIMGYGGDLWQRLPQVTYRRKIGANYEALVTAMRFARGQDVSIPEQTPVNGNSAFNDPVKTPYIGTRFAVNNWGAEKSGLAALSAAWRQFTVDAGNGIPAKKVDSYLLAGELSLPVVKSLHWNSKVGYGQALGDEFFRFGQALNSTNNNPIRTVSGFSEFTFSPDSQWSLAAGGGVDSSKGADLVGESSFTQYATNQRYYVNVTRQIIANWKVGAEFTYLQTKWTSGQTNYGNQVQLSSWYSFWL